MYKKVFALTAFVLVIFSVPSFSQQANFAGLLEDVAALRSEVARLRTELDELRAENARLLQLAEKKIDPSQSVEAKVASLRADIKEMVGVQRREITSETDAKVKALAEMTNRAMADLSKSLNQSIVVNKEPPTPTAKPADFPNSGIEYIVKPGDTLGKIMSQTGAKKNWVLYANPGLDPDKIFVGQKLFIPQKD